MLQRELKPPLVFRMIWSRHRHTRWRSPREGGKGDGSIYISKAASTGRLMDRKTKVALAGCAVRSLRWDHIFVHLGRAGVVYGAPGSCWSLRLKSQPSLTNIDPDMKCFLSVQQVIIS
ncbi:unnamed protein product [Urochloa humidicola]